MEEVTFEDLETLHPGASLLSKAHIAAEHRNLDHLLDAYQAFCLTSKSRLAWKALANFMELAMQSPHLTPVSGEPRLVLQPEDSYRIFLSYLTPEELGQHTSDIVVAFLHHAGVLQSQHHIECGKKSPGLEVADWTTKGPQDVQAIVRTHLLQLSRAFIRVLFEGIKDEIMVRSHEWDDSMAPSGFWAPCSGSLLAVLLRLDVQIDPALIQVIEQKAGSLREPVARRWTFQPHTRFASQRISLFSRLRNPQGTTSALESIQEIQYSDKVEDDRQSVMSFVGYDGNEQLKRSSKRSSFSDIRSFITAKTHDTGSSIRKSVQTVQSRRSAITNATTNRSSVQTFLSWPTDAMDCNTEKENEWSMKLRLRNIVSDPELEDWSEGRGQHAQYSPEERELIPLIPERPIGEGSTAVVDAVICRRVRLVRKVISLKYSKKRREDREGEAIREVQQLYKAQHAHIVRLVGTYVVEHELAILTYPRAEWNLEQFLNRPPTTFFEEERREALRRFFGCLARVLDFVHSGVIKHMDIKPQNILVRDIRTSIVETNHAFQVYLTDFGSSRFYPSVEDSETDSPTPYTRIYAAKEVLLDDFRGLPADVFSMGCVFAEMLAVAVDLAADLSPQRALLDACGEMDGKRKPFCTRVNQIRGWLHDLTIDESQTTLLAVRHRIPLMLSDDSQARPSARELAEDARLIQSCSSCDRATPEAFERIA